MTHSSVSTVKSPRMKNLPRTCSIEAVGSYVPEKILTNADLEQMVDTTHEWILQRTGISERHIVDRGVGTSDLAKEAALKAIYSLLRPGDAPNLETARTAIESSAAWLRAGAAATESAR